MVLRWSSPGRMMTGLRLVCWLVVVASCSVAPGQGALPKCTKVDNCACALDDGRQIDIRSLGYQGDKAPRFGFTPDPDGDWDYAFNPCYDFTINSDCQNVVACQKNDDFTYGLGSASTAVWSDDGNQYIITYSDGKRTTIVDLVCSTSATQPKLDVQGQKDLTKTKYYFTLTSNCACPGQCAGSSGSSGLSLGSILCIIFSVLVAVYFVGGMVFMKCVRGSEGKEIIPNSAFWSEMPGNIKDGVKFSTGLCRKNNKYEDL